MSKILTTWQEAHKFRFGSVTAWLLVVVGFVVPYIAFVGVIGLIVFGVLIARKEKSYAFGVVSFTSGILLLLYMIFALTLSGGLDILAHGLGG